MRDELLHEDRRRTGTTKLTVAYRDISDNYTNLKWVFDWRSVCDSASNTAALCSLLDKQRPFYRVPQQESCHGMSRWMQTLSYRATVLRDMIKGTLRTYNISRH